MSGFPLSRPGRSSSMNLGVQLELGNETIPYLRQHLGSYLTSRGFDLQTPVSNRREQPAADHQHAALSAELAPQCVNRLLETANPLALQEQPLACCIR